MTIQSVAQDTVTWVTTTNWGRVTAVGVGLVAVGTFALACYRYYQNFNTNKAKRQRQVGREGASGLTLGAWVMPVGRLLSLAVPGASIKCSAGYYCWLQGCLTGPGGGCLGPWLMHACPPAHVFPTQVTRNKVLVEELSKVLPTNRGKLTPGFIQVGRPPFPSSCRWGFRSGKGADCY